MKKSRLLTLLFSVAVVSGCAASTSGQPQHSSQEQIESTSQSSITTPASQPTERLSKAATYQEIFDNFNGGIGRDVADLALALSTNESNGPEVNERATQILEETDALLQKSDNSLGNIIRDLKYGPQVIVDVFKSGGGTFDLPDKEMFQATIEAGQACLTGEPLNIFADEISSMVDEASVARNDASTNKCSKDYLATSVTDGWNELLQQRGSTGEWSAVHDYWIEILELSEHFKTVCERDPELGLLSVDAGLFANSFNDPNWTKSDRYERIYEEIQDWLWEIDRTDLYVRDPAN